MKRTTTDDPYLLYTVFNVSSVFRITGWSARRFGPRNRRQPDEHLTIVPGVVFDY